MSLVNPEPENGDRGAPFVPSDLLLRKVSTLHQNDLSTNEPPNTPSSIKIPELMKIRIQYGYGKRACSSGIINSHLLQTCLHHDQTSPTSWDDPAGRGQPQQFESAGG